MKRFSQLARRFRTMSPIQILKRFGTIFQRYGIGTVRFSKTLNGFIEMAERYGIRTTFPVTATVMARHPSLFRNAVERGVELAIHGHRHIDYSFAEDTVFENHYELASAVFKEFGLTGIGHRFPYLRRNAKRLASLSGFGIQWDSSETVLWPVLDQTKLEPSRREALRRILDSYEVRSSDGCFSLPYTLNGLIEIPVSLPDDDILIERLGVTDGDSLFDIWWAMIEHAKMKGELAVLQLHPERFDVFAKPLELILQRLKMDTSAWIAPLGDIAEWWKNGRQWEWNIESIESGKYQIDVTCSNDAEIRIHGHEPVAQKSCVYFGPAQPAIGIEPGTDLGWHVFAKQEGFAVASTTDGHDCQHWIPSGMACNYDTQRRFLDRIQNGNLPLLRIRRWPKGKTFGVVITGDIDGVDFWDFLGRTHD